MSGCQRSMLGAAQPLSLRALEVPDVLDEVVVDEDVAVDGPQVVQVVEGRQRDAVLLDDVR